MEKEESTYKLRVKATKRKQEYLKKPMESLRKTRVSEDEAPGREDFYEERAGPSKQKPHGPTSPLSAGIQVTEWPKGFHTNKIPLYDGSKPSWEFILGYKAAVASAGGDDATMAKAFVLTARGIVFTWYSKLPSEAYIHGNSFETC
uniref:Retrotransposon gag domain-containing protein n=1 Tax=Arundo donax TaxID=35708 RepID=A0A0A8Z6P4_ARUDO